MGFYSNRKKKLFWKITFILKIIPDLIYFFLKKGLYEFLNWFDVQSWYPLGRIVGGTVYPGLMVTAGFIYNLLNFFNITVNIRNVCVLLAPLFSSNTALGDP